MKLFVIAALISVATAGRLEHLERSYLPPDSSNSLSGGFNSNGGSNGFGSGHFGASTRGSQDFNNQGSNGLSNGFSSHGSSGAFSSGFDSQGSNGFASHSHGSNGFGSNDHGSNGVGSNGHGSNGVGSNGHGSNGVGSNGHGLNGFGSNGLGSNGFGSNGRGSNGFGSNGHGSNGALNAANLKQYLPPNQATSGSIVGFSGSSIKPACSTCGFARHQYSSQPQFGAQVPSTQYGQPQFGASPSYNNGAFGSASRSTFGQDQATANRQYLAPKSQEIPQQPFDEQTGYHY